MQMGNLAKVKIIPAANKMPLQQINSYSNIHKTSNLNSGVRKSSSRGANLRNIGANILKN